MVTYSDTRIKHECGLTTDTGDSYWPTYACNTDSETYSFKEQKESEPEKIDLYRDKRLPKWIKRR